MTTDPSYVDFVLEQLESVLPAIHRSELLKTCSQAGWTIFETDPLCRAAKEYLALVRIIQRINEGK